MAKFESKIKTIEWVDTYSKMVDQTILPERFEYVNITSGQEMFDAIKTMIVRGAPAIGVAGAHGVVLYAQELAKENLSRDEFVQKLLEKADYTQNLGAWVIMVGKMPLHALYPYVINSVGKKNPPCGVCPRHTKSCGDCTVSSEGGMYLSAAHGSEKQRGNYKNYI